MRGNTLRVLPGRMLLVLVAVALVTWACDVTNPGPVQDDALNEPDAWDGLIAGMGRNLSDVIDEAAYTTGAVSREIHPSGSTGSYGITIRQQQGELADDEHNGHWNRAQRARWVAEDGLDRMLLQGNYEGNPTPEDPPTALQLAQSSLSAGYANRALGELFCEAVIDGSEILGTEPTAGSDIYFNRALGHFSNALQQATTAGDQDVELAARAGRASVYVDLGDWANAVIDANLVTSPGGWAYQISYSSQHGDEEWNSVFEASGNEPYRAHTQWNTAYGSNSEAGGAGSYYAFEPADPRVPFTVSGDQGDAAIECCGMVPWDPQTKYGGRGNPIDLSSTEEMRLIEAENELRNGNTAAAIDILNVLRTAAGVPSQWDNAVSSDSAWAILKRERGIELWLEARRLHDLKRWHIANTPGALDPLEDIGAAASPYGPSHLRTRSYCFPIPESESQTNPNVEETTRVGWQGN